MNGSDDRRRQFDDLQPAKVDAQCVERTLILTRGKRSFSMTTAKRRADLGLAQARRCSSLLAKKAANSGCTGLADIALN